MVTRFVNCLMAEGKKSTAESIFYKAMDIVAQKTKEDALDVFQKALANVRPSVEVKSRRVGGATYQIPVDVRSDRRMSLAIRWMITFARQRTGKTMQDRLAQEILDAYNNRGNSVKKREDTHRMAEANKAFAHYRW
jgi:small subunit ribosomal protein S7